MESWAWDEGNWLGSAKFCGTPGSSEPRAPCGQSQDFFMWLGSEVHWSAGWEMDPKFLPAEGSSSSSLFSLRVNKWGDSIRLNMDVGTKNKEFTLEFLKYKERIYMNLSGWLCCNILTCFLLFHFTAWREVPVRGKSTSSLTSINDTLHCVFLLFYSSLLQCTEVLSSNPQIRKLRRELDASQEKVSALTTQLTANVSTNSESKHWPGMHLMQQLPPSFF